MKPRRWNTVSEAKVVKFVEDNPGLTAAMIALLWRRPYGTISSVLHNLAAEGKIERMEQIGMRGGNVRAWRYYESVAKSVVNAALEDQS